MTPPAVYDHVRLTGSDYPDGIYRVVGAREGAVTLLRVADADGRRVNSGEVVTVGPDEPVELAPAENPDGSRPLGGAVTSKLEMLYWSVRAFVQQLAAHPLPTGIAAALVGVGAVGEGVIQLPDPAQSGLILLGSIALAYIGSGRL